MVGNSSIKNMSTLTRRSRGYLPVLLLCKYTMVIVDDISCIRSLFHCPTYTRKIKKCPADYLLGVFNQEDRQGKHRDSIQNHTLSYNCTYKSPDRQP